MIKKKTKLDSYTLTIIEDGRVKVVFDLNRPLWNGRFISDHAIVGLHTITNGRKGIKFVKATTGSRGIFNRDCDHYLQLTYNFGTVHLEFNSRGIVYGFWISNKSYWFTEKYIYKVKDKHAVTEKDNLILEVNSDKYDLFGDMDNIMVMKVFGQDINNTYRSLNDECLFCLELDSNKKDTENKKGVPYFLRFQVGRDSRGAFTNGWLLSKGKQTQEVGQVEKLFIFNRKKDWDTAKYTLTMILDGQVAFTVDITEKLNKRKIKNWIRCSKEVKERIEFSLDKVQVSLPFVGIIITFNLNTLGYVTGISIWGSFNFTDLDEASDIILRLNDEEFSAYDIINMANMLGMRNGYKADGSYFTVNTHDGILLDSLTINFGSTIKWRDMINQKMQHEGQDQGE